MNVAGGSADVTTYFALRLAATGAEATGLDVTAFDLQYVRSGASPVAKVDATALAATDSAHADNKAIEIDATDQPGLYRVDWPDAAFVAGVREVILSVKHASCFTEHLRVEIDTNVVLADGKAHGGTPGSSTATLALKEMNITNSAGIAVTMQSSGGDGYGLWIVGNGAGSGLFVDGGGDAYAATFNGNNTNGGGLEIIGRGSREAIHVRSRGAANATNIVSDNAIGLNISSATNGVEISTADGHGITISAAGSGKHDISLAGDGLIAGDFAAFTETYAADGAAVKLSQALYEILSFLEERTTSSTTVTCKKRDGSTTAMTLTLNNATQPTAITRAT